MHERTLTLLLFVYCVNKEKEPAALGGEVTGWLKKQAGMRAGRQAGRQQMSFACK